MKHILITGLALIAMPALAQTTSPDPTPPSTSTTPATEPAQPTTQVPDTTLSTSPTPSEGPRAEEGNLPSNTVSSANTSPMATAPDTTTPEAPQASYPICKAGEFDNCMEPGNQARRTKAKRMKRPR